MLYILAIVEHEGNLTKAAEKMFISQPALSQVLKKVEDEHGVRLFDRSRNPMTLTSAGRTYVRTARAMKDLSDSMQREFDDERNLERGELHIGVTPFRATYLLPQVLASYHRKYPGIDVILHQARNSDLLKLMGEARTDLTIGNFYDRSRVPEWLVCRELCEEEMILVMHRDHPLAGCGEIDDLETIGREPLMMSPRGEPMRRVIDDFFEKKNFVPRRVIETSNAEFCLRMIAEGVGISIMSDAVCGAENMKTMPAYVRFAHEPPRLVTTIAYSKQRYLSAASRAFIDELGALLGKVF